MTQKMMKFAAISLAGLVASGCTIPDLNLGQKAAAPAPTQVVAAPVKAPAAPKPVATSAPRVAAAPVETAAATPQPTAPKWGHQRIGGTLNTSDGDEDGGWN